MGRVLELIESMRDDGVGEFYLATSFGLDAPRKVHGLFSMIKDRSLVYVGGVRSSCA